MLIIGPWVDLDLISRTYIGPPTSARRYRSSASPSSPQISAIPGSPESRQHTEVAANRGALEPLGQVC
ncbi:hypothetical protein V496_06949 [Pseudogymnoascus sp. VKM F-4515 (FW-2607)]|nr:hypothetical protein V496_06949 [Pseudogymnoascus sp. VKM F-4515 (FW-2607)]